MSRTWITLVLCIFFINPLLKAQPHQDTVRLTLPEAEKMFLDSNLQLLAGRYNVDASKALIIQARLWPNPNLSISHALYSGVYSSA